MPAMTVVDRHDLHCILCGRPLESLSMTPLVREVWCANIECGNQGKRARFNDSLLTLLHAPVTVT